MRDVIEFMCYFYRKLEEGTNDNDKIIHDIFGPCAS